MKDYTLSQQYSIVALDGVDSNHSSMAKNAVIRGIAVAGLLERELFNGREPNPETLRKNLTAGLNAVRDMSGKEVHALETEMAEELKTQAVLEEVQDILACDINYTTAGIDIMAYRADQNIYQSIVEGVRAEVLEDGVISEECVCLLLLFRESGCLHDFFSVKEQECLSKRMMEATSENPVYEVIWSMKFYSSMERTVQNFLGAKKNLFKNPYLEGVNLLFPFLERRKAIFIDFVVLGTNVGSRRMAVLSYLSERGHYVEEVKRGSETLLRVDNNYYRIFPMTKVYYKLPVQGAYLVPVYE